MPRIEDYALIGSTEWVEDYLPFLRSTALTYLNLDIAVAGHRSDNVPFLDQIESGQRSFEHLFGGLLPATSSDVDRLEAAMAGTDPSVVDRVTDERIRAAPPRCSRGP